MDVMKLFFFLLPHLDGLARIPGHRASHQFTVQVLQRPAGLVHSAGRRGGDLGALGQVKVRRVQAVAVYPVSRQFLCQSDPAAGHQERPEQQRHPRPAALRRRGTRHHFHLS